MTIQAISRRDSQSGFTMVELIVVMIVIGIMAVTVLPRFDLLKGFDEVGYRDKVRATLEYARKSAVAQRRYVRVTAAGNGLSLDISSADPDAGFPAAFPRTLTLPGSGTNVIAPPSGGTLTASVSPLVFDALGRPWTSAGVLIAAASTYAVSGNTVTVEAETGYVH
jgi:MSHA pilin protein MshC